MTRTPHVVVIGGGLAGLAAAIACTDGGARVTLFEGRPRFGGATWSFERNGLSFDNGQHVYLRCCTAYRRFLERIGTADKAPLQQRLALPVLAPGRAGSPARLAWIRRNGLPVPFNLAPALLAYRHLSLRERLGIGRQWSHFRGCDCRTRCSTPRPLRSSRSPWSKPARRTALFEVIAFRRPTSDLLRAR